MRYKVVAKINGKRKPHMIYELIAKRNGKKKLHMRYELAVKINGKRKSHADKGMSRILIDHSHTCCAPSPHPTR
jgi:hypothetical protein